MNAKEINAAAYERIAEEFGEEHAGAVGCWYAGEDVPDADVPALLEEIADHYRDLD